MSAQIELNPADWLTAGTVGVPGRRVFMLQASRGKDIYTWILEKEQVVAMARGSYELLAQIGEHGMTRELLGKGPLGASTAEFEEAMALKPDEARHRIDASTISMRYESGRNLIEISFAASGEEGELEPPSSARIWVSPRQLAAFGVQGMKVVAQGRPLCPLCGHPAEPDGHRCPASNGHNPRIR